MSVSAYEIPLTPQAQTFPITLGLSTYTFTVQFRSVPDPGTWVMDIADALSNPLVQGIPLVTGRDLLAQFAYLQFPGGLWVLTDGNPMAVPTASNLGTLSHLYLVVTD